MFELSQPILNAIAVVVGLLLYALAWSSVSGLPAWLKWTLRLLLAGVVLLPFTVIALLPMQKTARAPMEAPRIDAPSRELSAPGGAAREAAEAARSAAAEQERRRLAEIKARFEQERAAEAARSAAAEEQRRRQAEMAEVERKADEARARVERQIAETERKLKDMPEQAAEAQKKAAEAADGSGGAGPRYYKLERPRAAEPEPTGGSGPRAPEASGGEPAAAAPPPAASNGDVPNSAAPPADTPRDSGGFGRLGSSGGSGGGGGGGGTRGLSGGFPSGGSASPPASSPPPVAAAPPPPPPPPAAASAPPRPVAAPAPAPVAAGAGEDKTDWTVVPVFFGTDREKVANDKRLEYGSIRGRKLDLGRALVTVPKQHEVPQVERPWAITIPYFRYKIYEQAEDPKKHFTMQELKNLTEAEMIDLVKQRLATSARFKDHAFVFIHGYNTSFDYAVYRAAQVAYDIKFDGAPFVYSWPSGGGIGSYTYDRESAAQAEPFLEEFLRLVTQKSGAKSVSLIAHSMGNQLLLRVLQDLNRSKPEGVKISQIILAAPDVDRDGFENIARNLKDMASGGITLYASSNDRALDVSRRFNGGIPRAGDVPGGVPLVVEGVDTIDATAVSMDSLGLHHSGYAESNALLSDIGALIQTGERPPEKRVPILKKVDTSKGPFWRYP